MKKLDWSLIEFTFIIMMAMGFLFTAIMMGNKLLFMLAMMMGIFALLYFAGTLTGFPAIKKIVGCVVVSAILISIGVFMENVGIMILTIILAFTILIVATILLFRKMKEEIEIYYGWQN